MGGAAGVPEAQFVVEGIQVKGLLWLPLLDALVEHIPAGPVAQVL